MKIASVVALVGLAVSLALPTFAQQKETVDPQIIEQLNALGKKYLDAMNDNDPVPLAALFTEDAVLLTDRGPVNGREAIAKWYVDNFKEWHHSDHIGKRDPNSSRIIGTAGNEIWANGSWSETVQRQTGEPIQLKGYWSAIYSSATNTREGDGWKIRMLTWNITASPEPQPL
jgi:uncharacterized protein (TIGR02246 family)